MQNYTRHFSDIDSKAEYSSVYYYLLAGIILMIAVFLFLPRVSVG